jgi:hypothetical protein
MFPSDAAPAQETAVLEKLPDAIGHALRSQRAGLEKIAFQAIDLRTGMAQIAVTSLAFADHAPIPARYTADGAGESPPLQWSGAPSGAASLVLIVEDGDTPTPQPLRPCHRRRPRAGRRRTRRGRAAE